MIAILCLSVVLLGTLTEGQNGCDPPYSYWPESNNRCNMLKPCCYPTVAIGFNRCIRLSRRECLRWPYVDTNAAAAAAYAGAPAAAVYHG